MTWFFTRSTERLQLEIRRARQGQGYEIVVRQPNGAEALEWCHEGRDLIRRQEEVAKSWLAHGWTPTGAVEVSA